METGESRTPLSLTKTIPNDTSHLSRLSTSNVREPSFPQTFDTNNFESDPAKLLPQLLDQLIALGQTAQQLRRALSGNGHRPEKLSEVAQQLAQGGEHATP